MKNLQYLVIWEKQDVEQNTLSISGGGEGWGIEGVQ